jgi:hypothetical protein
MYVVPKVDAMCVVRYSYDFHRPASHSEVVRADTQARDRYLGGTCSITACIKRDKQQRDWYGLRQITLRRSR